MFHLIVCNSFPLPSSVMSCPHQCPQISPGFKALLFPLLPQSLPRPFQHLWTILRRFVTAILSGAEHFQLLQSTLAMFLLWMVICCSFFFFFNSFLVFRLALKTMHIRRVGTMFLTLSFHQPWSPVSQDQWGYVTETKQCRIPIARSPELCCIVLHVHRRLAGAVHRDPGWRRICLRLPNGLKKRTFSTVRWFLKLPSRYGMATPNCTG